MMSGDRGSLAQVRRIGSATETPPGRAPPPGQEAVDDAYAWPPRLSSRASRVAPDGSDHSEFRHSRRFARPTMAGWGHLAWLTIVNHTNVCVAATAAWRPLRPGHRDPGSLCQMQLQVKCQVQQ